MKRTNDKEQMTKNKNLLSIIYYLLSKDSGFTLIELLVVIAIIAFVMAVFFPNFMGARQRARDSQRKTDLNHIRDALELYKLDQVTPAYPDAIPTGICGNCWSSAASCTQNIYMRKFPCDPSTNTLYSYSRDINDITKYDLLSCMENVADPDRDPTPAAGCLSTGVSYTIHEP